MRGHVSSRRIDLVRELITRRADLILAQLDDDRVGYDRYSAEDFRLGFLVSKFRRLSFRTRRGNGQTYARHFRALKRLLGKQEALTADYDREWQLRHEAAVCPMIRPSSGQSILICQPHAKLPSTFKGLSVPESNLIGGFRAIQI